MTDEANDCRYLTYRRLSKKDAAAALRERSKELAVIAKEREQKTAAQRVALEAEADRLDPTKASSGGRKGSPLVNRPPLRMRA